MREVENKKILVTGGSGMVGKSLQKILPNAIYPTSSRYNLTNHNDIMSMIYMNKPDVVVHLAAKVGGIMDNIHKPADYFTDNVLMNTLLIDECRKANVGRFIGISSTCIYPDIVETYPMGEEMLHEGPPTPTNFSYAYAKRAMAVQIEATNKQYDTKYQYLTPCNLYGEYDKYGENSHFVAALLKKIILAKKNGEDRINLYGTGKPLRQFMLADDLAWVIKKVIDDEIYESMNVATKEVFSIDKIARIALKACDAEYLKIEYDTTKPDGQYRKDVYTGKLRAFIPNFQETSLYVGLRMTYLKIKDTI